MGIVTLCASLAGQAKIQQARQKKGWKVTQEDDTPLKEASLFLIKQHAVANEWDVNDSKWLRDFEQLFRVEEPTMVNEIKTRIARSQHGSLLENIEKLIDSGEVFAKDISYGTWSRFASQRKLHRIKERTFKAYCQVLGLNWEEIAEPSELGARGDEGETTSAFTPFDPNLALSEPYHTPPPPTALRTRPYHNLPVPHHTVLIGRKKEMARLMELLCCDERASRIIIDGFGGVGKTSLVLEVAYRCLNASRAAKTAPLAPTFDAIIFTSAKQQHLFGNHILQRIRQERTLNDLFRTILHTIKCPDGIPTGVEEQLKFIQSRLQELHTLLIIDNLETIDNQDAVISFLCELPSTVKVVMTTRVRGALGVPIHLECLPPEEAALLIEHQAQEQSVQLKPEQFQAIYQRTSGLPLGIVYAIGQLSVYGSSSHGLTTRLEQAKSDLAQYCFEDSVRRLRGQLAHRLLMGLALFAKSASLDVITQVACPESDLSYPVNPQSKTRPQDVREAAQILVPGTPNLRVIDALAQLYQLRLVMQDEERYDMHPLSREYALAELQANSEFEQQARARWVNWYLQLSQAYPSQNWRQWYEYQDLDQEWENLQAVIDWCLDQNRYEEVRQFWQRIKGYTYLRGYWHERLTWIDWLLQAAEQRQDQATIAEVLVDKGWTLTLMGKPEQLTEVDTLFTQVLYLQDGEDLLLQLELIIDRVVLSIHQRKFTQADELLNQGKKVLNRLPIEESKRLRQQIRIDYYEAEVWFRTGNYEQAKIGYQKALEKAQAIQWQQVEVYTLNWLADVALAGEGNLDEAERLLQISMPIALKRKDKRSIAFHQRSWTHLEKMRGNLAEFQRWATQAMAGFESLGMMAEAQEMKSWLEAYRA
ncbi:MAG TPA: ATP-binding protein [Waterburya sp.]|jgi:LuxR family glucitol operon transcriptional activator